MTDLDFLLHCERLDTFRQTGRTTALAEACMKIDGVFLVASESQKRDLKRKYPELDVRIARSCYLIGNRKPFIFDHYAIMMLLEEEMDIRRARLYKIDELKANIKVLTDKLMRIKRELES